MKLSRKIFNEGFFSIAFKVLVLAVILGVSYMHYSSYKVAEGIDKRVIGLERRVAEQEKVIGSIKRNPNSLNMCMNDAAKSWDNYIRQNSTIHGSPDNPSYSIPHEVRQTANAKLEADNKNCEALFGVSGE